MPLFLASFNATRGSLLICFLVVFPAVQPIMLIVFSHFYYILSPIPQDKKKVSFGDIRCSPLRHVLPSRALIAEWPSPGWAPPGQPPQRRHKGKNDDHQ